MEERNVRTLNGGICSIAFTHYHVTIYYMLPIFCCFHYRKKKRKRKKEEEEEEEERERERERERKEEEEEGYLKKKKQKEEEEGSLGGEDAQYLSHRN
jgi:flagellar biosynthesis/type III secretory pathway M-ring protein FliF/YscJ